MIVDQNEPAEAVPEDAGDNMHQAQVVEEMNEQGIVPPRSVAKGTAFMMCLVNSPCIGEIGSLKWSFWKLGQVGFRHQKEARHPLGSLKVSFLLGLISGGESSQQ